MVVSRTKYRHHAKHPRVTRVLRDRIANGEYRLGEQLAHRDELEATLGASRATVQTALNTLIDEGFLRSVSGQGTFVAERPPFLTDVGFVFPCREQAFFRHRFYAAIHRAAQSTMVEREGKPRFYLELDQPRGEAYETVLDDCVNHRLAGLVFAASPYPLEGTSLLHDLGVPRVAIQSEPRWGIPAVYPDVRALYRMAMQRFAQLGRRRVAVLSCDSAPQLADRICEDAEQAGLLCWKGHVQALPSEWSLAAHRLLTLMLAGPGVYGGQRPDALIIADDNLVEAATAALVTMGVRVPEDLAVVVHANLPNPPVVHVPCDVLAFDAGAVVRACVDLIELQRRGGTPSELTLIPPFFVKS